MYQTLMVESEGAVDWLTLNRPERLNALDGTMFRELWAYFSELSASPTTRVVVIRGAGSAFCAGLDLKAVQSGTESIPSGSGGDEASPAGIIRAMRRCPQPIIALVHGAACGGGLAIALASDIRFAGESARMNDAFVKLGLSGCELGLSYFLPRAVGLSFAAELMYTGQFIDARRALAAGLVSRVVPDDELERSARGLISDMLRTTPLGLRKTKEVLNLAMKLTELDAVLEIEEHAQLVCMQGGDFSEALAAFAEKRDPVFPTAG